MVARAISHFRALRSGVWHRSASQPGSPASLAQYEFNAADIHDLYCLAGFQQECWQQLFQQHGIVPLRVVYEDMVEDYQSTVRRVLEFLDLEVEAGSIAAQRTLRQADEISRDWETRYRVAAAGLE
jgi:trehalose 2-sulfotransferase